MVRSKVVLKKNEDLKITIKGRPQLIGLIECDSVELEIVQYDTLNDEGDYNITFYHNGMFVSLWCNEYVIEERSTNE